MHLKKNQFCAEFLNQGWLFHKENLYKLNNILTARENQKEEVEKERKDAMEMGKEKNAPQDARSEKAQDEGSLIIILKFLSNFQPEKSIFFDIYTREQKI